MNRINNDMIVLSDTGRDIIYLVDGNTGRIIRNIQGAVNSGPHGITVCENRQFLYFSNQFDNSIKIYDLQKGTEGEEIGTGATPCHMAKVKEKLYVSNSDSDSISVIDTEERNGIMVISSGRMPHDVLEWNELIITAESGSDSIGIIDSREDEYCQRILLNCSPVHMCIIPGKALLAAACTEYGIETKGYVCIIDMNDCKLLGRLRIGKCLTDIAADKEGKYLYVADGGTGSVYKVELSTGLVVKDIFISGFISSVSYDPKRGKILVTEGSKNKAYIIDEKDRTVKKLIGSGKDLSHGAFI